MKLGYITIPIQEYDDLCETNARLTQENEMLRRKVEVLWEG